MATQADLDDAMALWASQNVASYQLDFARVCNCMEDALGPYISVVDETGAVTDVMFASNKTSVDSSSEIFADALTVERIFERIQDALDSDAAEVTVEYDTTYGYPVNTYIDYDALIADEEITFVVNSFVPTQSSLLVDRLDAAQTLWTDAGLSSYSFTFQQICEDCSADQTQPFQVQIVNGEIYSIVVSGTTTFGDNSLIQPVPEMFSYLQTQLAATTTTDMTVDTHQAFGYPVFVSINDDDIAFTMFNLVETSADEVDELLSGSAQEEQTSATMTTEAPTALPTILSTAPPVVPTAAPTAASVEAATTPIPTALTTTAVPTAAPVASPVIGTTDTTALPTSVPVTTPTTSLPTVDNNFVFTGSAECSANEACVGLADNCCPTMDNVFLCTCFTSILMWIWMLVCFTVLSCYVLFSLLTDNYFLFPPLFLSFVDTYIQSHKHRLLL